MATRDSRPEFVVDRYENGYGVTVAGDQAERVKEILSDFWGEKSRWVPCAECDSLVRKPQTIREGDALTETCPCCGHYVFYLFAPWIGPKDVV